MATDEPVEIAILAKAPMPGLAKTRLLGLLGAERAALLQARLIERTAEKAASAQLGPVTLWAAPDATAAFFGELCARYGFALRPQVDGDLGTRMLGAAGAASGPLLVIGTDCPALTPRLLQTAADVLRGTSDIVLIPAEDGGYVLIGMRSAEPAIFDSMPWGTPCIIGETRRRLFQLRLTWEEPALLWDIDTPDDLDRLQGTDLHPQPGLPLP